MNTEKPEYTKPAWAPECPYTPQSKVLLRNGANIIPKHPDTMKTLAQVAYEATLKRNDENWRKFGSWENAPQYVHDAFYDIAEAVVREFLVRSRKSRITAIKSSKTLALTP